MPSRNDNSRDGHSLMDIAEYEEALRRMKQAPQEEKVALITVRACPNGESHRDAVDVARFRVPADTTWAKLLLQVKFHWDCSNDHDLVFLNPHNSQYHPAAKVTKTAMESANLIVRLAPRVDAGLEEKEEVKDDAGPKHVAAPIAARQAKKDRPPTLYGFWLSFVLFAVWFASSFFSRSIAPLSEQNEA
eukprot:544052-Prymnesium_polylepis.1